ncbi:MAG: hypothetical protein ACI4J0_04685 [Huintestinicola sp.]|uniref:hypothetical protein n=1 Tax=Huintestinicola sp. TaxID=2981661 RepID=UPI003F047A22
MMEHSIIFPLPLSIHIGFVVISVILLMLCYKKRKYTYELYMLVGIVSTLFIYVCKEKPYFYILGLEEMILLALTIVDMAKVSKAAAAAEKAEQDAAENTSETDTEETDPDETAEKGDTDKSE